MSEQSKRLVIKGIAVCKACDASSVPHDCWGRIVEDEICLNCGAPVYQLLDRNPSVQPGSDPETTYDPKPRSSDSYVVCPWCGHKHGDAWEWAKKRMEMRCDQCGNAFTVDPDYSVTYRSFVTGREKP